MVAVLILIFVFGYLLITLEQSLKLDKTVPALIMATLMWSLLAVGVQDGWFSIIDPDKHVLGVLTSDEMVVAGFNNALFHHFGKTAEILVFLIGAMTIVELIDLHRGFSVVRGFVNTKSRTRLLWIIGVISFFLSAIIDNLTATIVMVTLLRVVLTDEKRRMWYVGMAIIAANAGGAWSPIGDVTSTMLWISDKVTAVGLAKYVIIPSLVCFLVSFGIASLLPAFRGYSEFKTNEDLEAQRLLSSRLMLFVGLGGIVFVPIFTTVTDLPPYLGMILALGVVWLMSEYVRPEYHISRERRQVYSARKALSRIEMSSILFFLGILMSVGALQTLAYGVIDGKEVGTLRYLAEQLDGAIANQDLVIVALGVASAIIDNVPLAAATMAMYTDAIDSRIWHFIAYCVGTGGSMIIIGSAGGVAAMGMEKIGFGWYLKKIGWLAAVGFISGAVAFVVLYPTFP